MENLPNFDKLQHILMCAYAEGRLSDEELDTLIDGLMAYHNEVYILQDELRSERQNTINSSTWRS